ncbi:MAG: four helix bundle protein [Cytophagia bacterium]|nr:four helix bundle protein [Cytophagia bacterium]
MHKYRELEIWKRAIDLTVDVYALTQRFPEDEKFGLTSQIKRAAVSVPSNIAEGAGRNSNKEFNQFLGISTGSIFEVETQLILAERLNFLSSDQIEEVLNRSNELVRMTKSLKSKLI